MVLTRIQQQRFLDLFYALITFANERLQVADEPFEPWHPSADQHDVIEVTEAVMADRRIIDEFIKRNPVGLNKRDLAQVEQWKSAISDSFVVMEHGPLYSVFMSNDRLFGVVGISRELITVLPDTPCYVKTVLLPFEGSIVYATNIESFPVTFGGGLLDMFEEEYENLLATTNLILTSDEFLAECPAYEQRRGEREVEQLMKDLEAESAKDEPVPGFSRSPLADLDFEARNEAVDAHVREDGFEISEETFLTICNDEAWRAYPPKSLAEYLALRSKSELYSMAKNLKITGISKLNKEGLAHCLAKTMLSTTGLIEEILANESEHLSQSVQRVLEQGGSITYTAKELAAFVHNKEERLSFRDPALALYCHEGGYTFAIVPEFAEIMREIDWEMVASERTKRNHARTFITDALDWYGIVDHLQLCDMYLKRYPNELSSSEFLELAVNGGPSSLEVYGKWIYDGNIYFVNAAIAPEGSDWALFDTEYDPFVTLYDDDRDEQTEEALQYYREYLAKRQREIELRPIPQDDEHHDAYEYYLRIPEVQQLCKYLDAHIPEEEDEYYFAENVLEEIYPGIQLDAPPQDFIEFVLERFYQDATLPMKQELTNRVMNAVNAVPRWSNCGWSPIELIERTTGQKMFRNEDGSMRKVGRNEPCPCGSGKKYKKCCG